MSISSGFQTCSNQSLKAWNGLTARDPFLLKIWPNRHRVANVLRPSMTRNHGMLMVYGSKETPGDGGINDRVWWLSCTCIVNYWLLYCDPIIDDWPFDDLYIVNYCDNVKWLASALESYWAALLQVRGCISQSFSMPEKTESSLWGMCGTKHT